MNVFSCHKKNVVLFMLMMSSLILHAQQRDLNNDTTFISKPSKNWRKVVLVPTLLVGAGLWATTDNEVLEKVDIHQERQEHFPHFHTRVDDYLQYAPIAAVYGLRLAGVKGQHDFINTTVLLVKTEIIMTAMVIPLKKFTAVPRPDTGAKNSFPSGHTAQAFAAATFLHLEYGEDHPVYSVLGYTAATGVGVLRVLNNRHWVSDVLAGAGIGILSANLAYATHKNKWGHHRSGKGPGLVMTPSYSQHAFGMYMLVKLK